MKPNASQKQASIRKNNSRSLLKEVQDQLTSNSDTPYLDALQLLSHLTGSSRSQILAHPDPQLSRSQADQLEVALQQLQQGTPLPYILGEWEFFRFKFQLTPDVLIPRPETEGLVELALEWLQDHPHRRSCLELGTGCGCIAISLAKTVPDLHITATDISKSALKVARKNARQHKIEDQIRFLKRDLLTGISGKVDLLIANLPYIPTNKLERLDVFLSEPILALDGGVDGLRYIKEVFQNAPDIINPGGAVFLEIDEDTGSTALALAHDIWPGITIQLKKDLAGQNRYLAIQLP